MQALQSVDEHPEKSGNTIVVTEHKLDVINTADWLIEPRVILDVD